MAEDQDDAQKTEEPTSRKLQESRKKGQVAQSREINNFIMIFAAALIVMLIIPGMAKDMIRIFSLFIEHAHDFHLDEGNFVNILKAAFFDVSLSVAMVFLTLVIAALGTGFLQNGIMFSTESLEPKLERISPLKGFKRLFSLKSVVEFAKGITKLCIVGFIAFLLMRPMAKHMGVYVTLSMPDLVKVIHGLAVKLLIGVTSVIAVIAGLDFLYQRFEFMKSMRMTKQEIKDEYKQTEGDPLVKSKLRQIRQDKARQRMMAAVPEADVVITNPTHYAIALQYELSGPTAAPKCVAKGSDAVALRIRSVAKENDVPLIENPPLARALFESVEIDDEVPEEHYKAVAEIIAYVFKLKGKMS